MSSLFDKIKERMEEIESYRWPQHMVNGVWKFAEVKTADDWIASPDDNSVPHYPDSFKSHPRESAMNGEINC